MRRPHRLAALAAASVGVLALANIATSSAATLGGLHADSLGGARASTQRLTGVELGWVPVLLGSDWGVGGLSITADPGQSFREGDVVKVTIDRSDTGPCEVAATVAQDAATVSVSDDAIGGACQRVTFDEISSVALSVTGDDLTASFTGGIGDIRGTLASFTGGVVDPHRTLRAGTGTAVIDGVSYIDEIVVDVTANGLTPAALAGTRVLAALYHADAQTVVEYSGVVSLDSSEPVSVTSGSGDAVTVTIDPLVLADRGGTHRARTADVNRVTVILYTPQHLGAAYDGAPGAYAVSTVAGTIEADSGGGSPAVSSALDPINLDARLSYQYSAANTNDSSSSLSFCHRFTVTNTSSQPVEWTLTFDTSYVPLWGFDPTAPGAFNSAWNWETVSYDPTTHLWTIRGAGWNRTLQPGSTAGDTGYCVGNVPVPAVDHDAFSYTLSVLPSSHQYWVALDLSITSTSHWNMPWEITVDLADYVCAAGLEGRSLQWHTSIEVIPVQGTVYTLRGRAGAYTRFVSASKPLTLSPVLGYGPANGQYLPCGHADAQASAGEPSAGESATVESAAVETAEPGAVDPDPPGAGSTGSEATDTPAAEIEAATEPAPADSAPAEPEGTGE